MQHILVLLPGRINKQPVTWSQRSPTSDDKSKFSRSCTGNYGNCYFSRRCCNSPSWQCYTRAASKKFAQCRKNACVGLCGWDCRLLRHGVADSAPAVYGAGAQNWTQAVADMMRPLPVGQVPKGRTARRIAA